MVKLYEDNIDEALNQGVRSKHTFEMDMKEWLYAIRHRLYEEEKSLASVLRRVQQWEGNTKSPLSQYYLFVLHSLIGLGTSTTPGHTENLAEAQRIRDSLNIPRALRPRFPWEWLGLRSKGIKQLISNRKYRPRKSEKHKWVLRDNWDDLRVNVDNLQICKGTVCAPNTKPQVGTIEMDVRNAKSIKVHYVPLKNDLVGRRYELVRVEFVIGFTHSNGYEAYDVHKLGTQSCKLCCYKVEFTSRSNMFMECPRCSQTIKLQNI